MHNCGVLWRFCEPDVSTHFRIWFYNSGPGAISTKGPILVLVISEVRPEDLQLCNTERRTRPFAPGIGLNFQSLILNRSSQCPPFTSLSSLPFSERDARLVRVTVEWQQSICQREADYCALHDQDLQPGFASSSSLFYVVGTCCPRRSGCRITRCDSQHL